MPQENDGVGRMKNKDNKGLKIFLILAGIFVLVSLVLFLIPFKYEASLFYNVQEPYEVKEPYQVQETYTDYEDIEYKVLEKSYYNYFWTSGCDVWVVMQNIDNFGGYFSVDFDVTTSKGNYKTTSKNIFLANGDSHKFLVSFEGDYKSSNYDVNPPSKEVTKTKIVTKYLTVTKYETIQKERQIYKKDTLFNMITKRTQYVFYE